MIRFIVKRQVFDAYSGQANEYYQTVDFDVPELEKVLTGGWSGGSGYDKFNLVGAEVIPATGG